VKIKLSVKKLNIFFKATVWLLVFCFFTPNFVLAKTSEQNKNKYLVELKARFGIRDLKNKGFLNPEKFASFSTAKEFKNVFKFESVLSESLVQAKLFNKFNYLEKVGEFKIQNVVTNDPGFTSFAANPEKQWSIPKTGFDSAWIKTLGSKKNIIAIIDTGVDATHEDLKTINYVPGLDFFTKKSIIGNVNSDDNGHGTIIAGILGATVNNSIGISGLNWDISIMPLKALDAEGKGDSAKIIEAIIWATDHGAKFINLSIGGIGLGHDTALASAISYAFNKDVIIVAAAGNDNNSIGSDLDTKPVFPICDDNDQNMVIGVTAVDINDKKPDFANYGQNCIDVSAPGKRILSTINFDPITKKYSPNSYVFASGTSLAVPFVIAQAALIKALYPNATNKQIRDTIISSADLIDNENLTECLGASCKSKIGSGRINVQRSLDKGIILSIAKEGDLVKIEHTGLFYFIQGGQKRPVSPFVYNQRFINLEFKTLTEAQIESAPLGSYASPAEGTLVRLDKDKNIYIIDKGQKRLVTSQIFKLRNFKDKNVSVVSFLEFNSWVTGNYYPPKDGTIVTGYKNKNYYWVIGEVLHPMNSAFIADRGLKRYSAVRFSDIDINNLPKGEPYIR
jgi:hypothetical protein